MCWKQEWAMAINNLNGAIAHVERARAKLQKRLERNEANLQRMRQNKKCNYPSMLEPVQLLIRKNEQGMAECEQVIGALRQKQDQLFQMVHTYGIKHSDNPQRVYRLMGKYPLPKAVVVGANDVIFKRQGDKEVES